MKKFLITTVLLIGVIAVMFDRSTPKVIDLELREMTSIENPSLNPPVQPATPKLPGPKAMDQEEQEFQTQVQAIQMEQQILENAPLDSVDVTDNSVDLTMPTTGLSAE